MPPNVSFFTAAALARISPSWPQKIKNEVKYMLSLTCQLSGPISENDGGKVMSEKSENKEGKEGRLIKLSSFCHF